jgi:ATP-binding cassette subfamily B protein
VGVPGCASPGAGLHGGAAEVADIGVPVVLEDIIDALTPGAAALAVPAALVAAYRLLRLSTTLFTELRC